MPSQDPNKRQPWERRPDESEPAYAAFTEYRDQIPGTRSIRKVAQQLHKSVTLIGRWSRHHEWILRVAEWDADQQRQWHAEVIARRRAAAKRHIAISQGFQQHIATRLQSVNPMELSLRDLKDWAVAAAQLERAALGMDGRFEVTGEAGAPLALEVSLDLEADERRARIAELMDEARRRLAGPTKDEESSSGDDEEPDD